MEVTSRRAATRLSLLCCPVRVDRNPITAWRHSSRSGPELWIERVPQRVAQHVEGQHRETDREAWRDRHPWCTLHEFHRGAAEHQSPRRRGFGNAETQETQ